MVPPSMKSRTTFFFALVIVAPGLVCATQVMRVTYPVRLFHVAMVIVIVVVKIVIANTSLSLWKPDSLSNQPGILCRKMTAK